MIGGARRAVLFYLFLGAAVGWCIPSPVRAQQLPTPVEHFGFEPGTDRRLANWTELTRYYERLAEASPRVTLDTLGLSTRGRPLVLVIITSERNHARLEELRSIQERLADPRTIASEEERERLLEEGRAVVLVTHGIHSNEVGSAQVAPRLIHRLASSDEPDVLEILENTVVLDVPSLNPDGTDWVSDWYDRWVGSAFEAAPLPWLYHYYVGHDNNRDWYGFTQIETQHVVREAHNAWHPHVVHDIHQMERDGARIFVPPYVEPWEPGVDPALTAAVNDLGTWVAARLQAEGKEGVVVSAIYDAYAPARAYQHYHAGARILSETASARLATPDSLHPLDLRPRRGFDPRRRSWNHPDPWRGGRWGLPQIVDYMESAAMAVLTHAARNRRHWLEGAHAINRRAVEGWEEWPAAWVIPGGQERPGVSHLLRILRMGEVEVHRTSEEIEIGDRLLPAGALVIPMRQPYASFAQTLLVEQEYPDLRRYPGGPVVTPYDATAHTLPLLMGVEVRAVESLPEVELGPVVAVPEAEYRLPDGLVGAGAPRIAIYKSWQEPMEAGWTRWLFDRHDLPYDTLHDAQIREGRLGDRYDVIVLQSQRYASMVDGWSEEEMPEEWAGGLGVQGSRALRDFVRNGGRLVAIEDATDFAIRVLDLDVSNAVERLPPEDFYVPGSILRMLLESRDPTSSSGDGSIDPAGSAGPAGPVGGASGDPGAGGPAGPGGEEELAVWYGAGSRGFTVADPSIRVLGRYGEIDPLLSGWMVGPEHLAGLPALVEAEVGRGSVVLFGFQPNYRGQSVATWPLLFATLIPEPAGDDAGGDP